MLKPQDKRDSVVLQLKIPAELNDRLLILSKSLDDSDPKYIATELIRTGIEMALRSHKSTANPTGRRGRPKSVQAVA